jgi:multicomponent Na+:H+ antiporter subunit F
MFSDTILSWATNFALVILPLSFLITVIRIILGPTLSDRVVALDMLVAIAIGFISVIALKTGYYLYIDIAISLGLVGFLATAAFARFILVSANKAKLAEPKPRPSQAVKKKAKSAKGKS